MHDFIVKAMDARSVLTEADLEALLQPFPAREGLHLDYKRGEWLKEPSRAAADLRKWISSFANSDGGALVVGVPDERAGDADTPPWTVMGCRPPGKGSLSDWASDALWPLRMVPPPAVHVIPTPDASYGPEVLVVATDRSVHRLVSCFESGKKVTYFRHGHSTHEADPWLLEDLLTSRRSRPRIIPTDRVNYSESGGHIDSKCLFDGTVTLENASPVWAEGLHVTLVGLWEDGSPISNATRESVYQATWGLGQLTQIIPGSDQGTPPWDLPPFAPLTLRFGTKVLDDPSLRGGWFVCGALLVSARNDLPRWMQLTLQGSTYERGVRAKVLQVPDGSRPLVFAGSPDELYESGANRHLPDDAWDWT